ncbi:unnamed protein product [Orchesella dallaii]|uniref:Integral membrane protein DGCR2/IDD n=1 Tax=Orchesella dallaii TaxID=48710 RepID=A0ABP1RY17_9HEXA
MSHLGVLATPSVVTENVTNQIFHGFGSAGGVISGNGEGFRPSVGKHCIDLHQRLIPHGVHFVPGPDECTLCACDDGEPKWCKAVLCSPPQDCKSFRVGNSCCDFICLDDSLNNNGGPNTGGPYLSRPVEIANFVPKVVIAAVTAMLSLSLLFFLIHRLRQRHIQGRLNSARARRSTQMCDECDDTRSLDFSNDFFEHRMNSPHLYPPQYLAWWKPPSSYFPPRGEAPPPYEEAMMATTSIGGGGAITTNLPVPSYNNNNLQNQNNNNNLRGSSENGLLSDMPIIVPPPVLPPGPVASQSHRSPAIQRLASAIASSAGAFPKSIGSGGACATTVITSSSSSSSSAVVAANNIPKHAKDHLLQQQPSVHLHNHHHQEGEQEGARLSPSSSALSSKRSSPKLKSESSKVNKHKSSKNQNHQEPQPGPSGNSGGSDHLDASSSPRAFKIKPPQHGPAPPPYEDAIYSLHPSNSVAPPPPPSSGAAHGRDFYRHSLTLPPRRYLDSPSQPQHHLVVAAGYPSVVIRTGGSSQGHLSLFPSENHSHRSNNSSGQHQHHHHNQRYSLQFPVSVGEMGGDDDGRGGDWSSSSSTLSLSTTPNSPVGRAPSELSSSSESSVSESHSHPPPPPPAPSSGPSSSSNNSSRA